MAWEELHPFADKKSLKAARLMGLREHPQVGRPLPTGGLLLLMIMVWWGCCLVRNFGVVFLAQYGPTSKAQYGPTSSGLGVC